MKIYERVRAICEQKGVTVASVESQAGLGHATIRKWDDSVPRIDSLLAVSKILDVSIEALIGEQP